MALRRDQPSFASEVVTFESDPIGIRFEMWVADAEHARFYRDPSEALYLVHVTERASAEAGRIGAAVGLPDDAQASVGESIWTTTRLAEYEAGVVQGGPAYDFVRAFLPAVRQCLR